jgi:hypothetical protein
LRVADNDLITFLGTILLIFLACTMGFVSMNKLLEA